MSISERAEDLYFAGLKKHRTKDYDGAIELVSAALEEDPTFADAWEALGVLYEKTDQLDLAIEATHKLLEVKPDEIMAHTNLSRFYMKKGWKEKAEEEQSKARVLGWKAELAGHGGSDEGLQEAASGAPEPGAPALVDFVSGNPIAPVLAPELDPEALDKKIAQFEALIAGNRDDVLGRLTLGRTYLEAERPDDAARILEELLSIKADYTAAYVVLGEAYEKAGKLARALKTYQKGIELADSRGDLHPRNQMTARLTALKGE